MAQMPANTGEDPTDRLLGEAPTMQALRARIRQLVAFDTPGLHPLSQAEHRREPVLHREFREPYAVTEEQRIRNLDEGVSVLSGHRGKSRVEIVGTLHLQQLELQP